MLDRDLAGLYGVEAKYLKRQVRRNLDRFPPDFMFKLSKQEFKDWRCQFVTSNSADKMGAWKGVNSLEFLQERLTDRNE